MSNLVPLPVKRAAMSRKALDTSVDDFDTLLDDMLDSPRVVHRGKSGASRERVTDNDNDVNDFDMMTESFSNPSSPESPFAARKIPLNPPDDFNELSVDNGDELLSNFKVTADELEDSILGGLLKGKKNLNIKKAANTLPTSVKDSAKAQTLTAKSSWGAVPTSQKEVVESAVENYSEDDYESSDDDRKVEKGKSNYSGIGITDKKPLSRTGRLEVPLKATQYKV